MKPLLVGEANPYGSDPHYALYPDPPGCAGDRLCRKVMGLEPDDYLERFDRVNLCPSRWSTRGARERAAALLEEYPQVPLVLLGAKVTRAFRWLFTPFESWVASEVAIIGRGRTFVCLPHPSGLSRAWNAPGAYDRARSVLREAGALP